MATDVSSPSCLLSGVQKCANQGNRPPKKKKLKRLRKEWLKLHHVARNNIRVESCIMMAVESPNPVFIQDKLNGDSPLCGLLSCGHCEHEFVQGSERIWKGQEGAPKVPIETIPCSIRWWLNHPVEKSGMLVELDNLFKDRS